MTKKKDEGAPDMRKLITLEDASDRLGVSRNNLMAVLAGKKIPVIRLGKKTVRVRVADIETMIDSSEEDAKAPADPRKKESAP